MTTKALIMDGAKGTGQYAGTTHIGELLLAGFGTLSNISNFKSLTTTGAFNFFGPIAGQQFIITSMIFDAISGITITVYEAANPFTIAIDKTLFKINLRTDATISVSLSFGGFLAVSEGEYLNVFADSAVSTPNVTIIGYYQPITHNI